MPGAASPKLVNNGVYYITNAKYATSYANLIDGNANAAVAGTKDDTGSARKWLISNSNNQITVESIAASGYYATGTGENIGIPIYANSGSTTWSLVSAGGSNYYIRTTDGEYSWSLDYDTPNYTVLLKAVRDSTGTETQWLLTKTS